MTFSLYQIVLYRFPLDKVQYPKPCVIVDITQNGILGILPISTKSYGNDSKFILAESDSEFVSTGLSETSYIFGNPVLDIHPSLVIKVLGNLTGHLRTEFIDWIG